MKQIKEHRKMYKAGKHWVIAGISTMLMFSGSSIVMGDEIVSSNGVLSTQLSTVSSGMDGSVNWYITDDGVLHLGSGKLAQRGVVDGRNGPIIEGQLRDSVTKIVFDGVVTTDTDATSLFTDFKNVVSIENLNNLDISNADNVGYMFAGMTSLTSLDVSGLDFSKVTNMSSLFNGDKSLERLNLSTMNTLNAPDSSMDYMFYGAPNLKQVTLGQNFKFAKGKSELNSIAKTSTYSGYWRSVGTGSPENPTGTKRFQGVNFPTQYVTAVDADTYVWEKAIATPVLESAKDGDREIKGTGTPGDVINIKDTDGKVIGTGTVDENGQVTIPLNRPLVGGETITGVGVDPINSDNISEPTTLIVAEKEKRTPDAPNLNQPKDGDQTVTGTGTPGDEITIKDKDGKVIGTGTVDENGQVTIPLDRPLVGGETITGTATDPESGNPSSETPLNVTEKEKRTPDAPDLNQPKDGDQTVTGTGTPGDEITIKDKDGKVIGTGTVDENGQVTIPLDRPLVGGETITGTATDPESGNPSSETPLNVTEKEKRTPDAPDLNQPKDGDQTVTGTGTPGDEITIKDKDGKVIGTGTVDENGQVTIPLDRPLVGGETITGTATDPKSGNSLDKQYVISVLPNTGSEQNTFVSLIGAILLGIIGFGYFRKRN